MGGAFRKAFDAMGFNERRLDDEDEYDYGVEDAGGDVGDELDVTPFPSPRLVGGREDYHRIATVRPSAFEDAPKLASVFRGGVPVILDLTALKEADARRLIDFASGLAMGLEGKIERVTVRVFLLSPKFIEIAHEDGASSSSSLFN